MLEHWEKYGTIIHEFKEQLETLMEMLPQSAKMHKQQSILNKCWKKLQRAHNDFDQFVTPVKSVKVTSPFLEDPDFAATWKMWKEYLVEQHGIHLRSRAELMSLKRMADIAGKQPKTAVAYLEFAMSRADRNFYKVNENEVPAAVAAKTSKKVYKAPVRYSAPAEKQKTLQEEINEYKQSKQKKS